MVADDLPWGFSSSTLLYVAESNGVLLDQVYPLTQPDPNDTVHINSGAELIGRIVLTDHIPNFEIEHKKRELIIFWTYKPGYFFTAKFGDQPRVGGWFSVGKKGRGE